MTDFDDNDGYIHVLGAPRPKKNKIDATRHRLTPSTGSGWNRQSGNLTYLYLSSEETDSDDSNGYTYVFGDAHVNGAENNTVRHQPTPGA